MASKPDALLEEIRALLEKEKKALLEGNLDEIAKLTEHKSDLVDKMRTQADAPVEGLDTLRETVMRNQALLDEALQGIRAVTDRLADVNRVRHNLDTYDKSGQKRTIRSGQSSFERRA